MSDILFIRVHQEDVRAAVCLDSQGMILASKKASSTELKLSSVLSAIPDRAQELQKDRAEVPVVILETDSK
ncbi:DgyrCDS4351 [Dimorphilus gyrociliatus]|uniref:DgyrCDS4351 n=1 Tax=Dimorphilus gyrociliatus TaxID=2664684 RepID=A0A7I8VGA4_9ANNE|nr:DgyrCDS4351 [Dimorphilus gyrociliatus]